MHGQGVTFEKHKVGDVYRTLARTVSETDIVNFVNQCGFTEPLFLDMEYVKRESVFGRRAAPGAHRGPGAGGRHDPGRGRGGRQA
jgi:acyl dehydratase